jgi:hypothetical protein
VAGKRFVDKVLTGRTGSYPTKLPIGSARVVESNRLAPATGRFSPHVLKGIKPGSNAAEKLSNPLKITPHPSKLPGLVKDLGVKVPGLTTNPGTGGPGSWNFPPISPGHGHLIITDTTTITMVTTDTDADTTVTDTITTTHPGL